MPNQNWVEESSFPTLCKLALKEDDQTRACGFLAAAIEVPPEATTVAPDGFCVVSDLLWREPELLDFSAAVQSGLIVVVWRRRVLRLAVREQAPNFLWLAFHNDHQVAPSVVVENLSVALLRPVVGMQNVIKAGAIHRKCSAANRDIDLPPRDLGLSEESLHLLQPHLEGPTRTVLLQPGIDLDVPAVIARESVNSPASKRFS